jgi:phosphatidylserine/phosphatidylglycerophosphate/cardiolipin synthase-like enzyme
MPIDITFLEQDTEGQPGTVANLLAEFITAARSSVHIAIYDFRLRQAMLADPVVGALRERAGGGVEVRIAYDKGKPERADAMNAWIGADPAPRGTAEFVEQIGGGVQVQAIDAGSRLMHNKYVIRDGHTQRAALWTGSGNFTDDAWTLQENNIVRIASPTLCAFYETDFGELWESGEIGTTGANDASTAVVDGIRIEADFSPGHGRAIDQDISWVIGAATRRVKIACMVISSGTVLGALADVLGRSAVREFGGMYDATQMDNVIRLWEGGAHSQPKIDLFKSVAAHLVGKRSTPYSETSPHDFMHNKVAVVDDIVITGSFNFSNNATKNAENVLTIHDRALADRYAAYIDGLVARYTGH